MRGLDTGSDKPSKKAVKADTRETGAVSCEIAVIVTEVIKKTRAEELDRRISENAVWNKDEWASPEAVVLLPVSRHARE